MTLPLKGIRVSAEGAGGPPAVAQWFLSGLGAAPSRPAGGRLCVGGHPIGLRGESSELPGLPRGTLEYATGLALAGAGLASVLDGMPREISTDEVAAHLMLPAVAATASGASSWPEPPPPRVLDRGAVSCELGGEGDAASFDTLLQTMGSGPLDARDVARRAQEWRLPVVDYRARPRYRPVPPFSVSSKVLETVRRTKNVLSARQKRRGAAPLEGIVVCDLTAIWAGPLATRMLAALGARVYKIEPACRLDGLRGQPAMFAALNDGKERLDLDLRREADRSTLLDLVEVSDIVIDSFSPRVMPNFALTHRDLARVRPDVVTISMPAFPPRSPRRAWVAYGTAIHATSGLGDLGSGRFTAPAQSYPDPLAGLTAFAVVLALYIGRRRGWPSRHLEVPLYSATLPLLRYPSDPALLSSRDPEMYGRLLADGRIPRTPVAA